MDKLSLLTTFIFILSLINSNCANLCINTKEEDYINIKPYTPIEIKLEPEKEACFKYIIEKNDNNFSLSFLKGSSYTVEVLIYDAYKNIKRDNNGKYIGYVVNPYLIGKHSFQEIDASLFNKEAFIIIRETKSYFYSDYMKLYDSNYPIKLEENKPITINNFMSNEKYNFILESSNDIKIVYSSKIKGAKRVIINQGNKTIHNSTEDFVLEQSATDLNTYEITIKIEKYYSDVQKEKIDQKFSIIYHENVTLYQDIHVNELKQINYTVSSQKDQVFKFNINTKNTGDYNTVNFELDYNNKINNYIHIIMKDHDNRLDKTSIINKEVGLYSYDVDSDEYYRIYFKESKKNYYIIVTITSSTEYKAPKYFNISFGEAVSSELISQTTKFSINALAYIPKYVKFIVENEKKFLFYAPYEQYCTLINGDLVDNFEINTNYLDEASDLHVIDSSQAITARIYSKSRKVDFFFEEYNPEDVIINNSPDRIKDIYSLEFTDEDCNGKIKNVIFKYDIENFSWGQNNFSNYWTTDGDMITYYKNNSEFKDTFFATEILEKETIFDSKTHLDIFTIKCNKPGIFYIRPYKKSFIEETHELNENCIYNIEINNGTEIVQLYSPKYNPPSHIYFSITTFSQNEIEITPDTEGLFNSTKINSNNRTFQLEIDAKIYKMDKLAIKLTSNSSNEIELIETSDSETSTYQKIRHDRNTYDVDLSSSNFVIFLDNKTNKIEIKFNNRKKEEIKENIAYGLVNLTSEDPNYIPLAFNFDETKKEKLKDDLIAIEIDPNVKKNEKKPYRALIFSIEKNKINTYNIDIMIYGNNNEILLNIIVVIALLISVVIILVILIVFLMKMCMKKDQYFDSEDSLL